MLPQPEIDAGHEDSPLGKALFSGVACLAAFGLATVLSPNHKNTRPNNNTSSNLVVESDSTPATLELPCE